MNLRIGQRWYYTLRSEERAPGLVTLWESSLAIVLRGPVSDNSWDLRLECTERE